MLLNQNSLKSIQVADQHQCANMLIIFSSLYQGNELKINTFEQMLSFMDVPRKENSSKYINFLQCSRAQLNPLPQMLQSYDSKYCLKGKKWILTVPGNFPLDTCIKTHKNVMFSEFRRLELHKSLRDRPISRSLKLNDYNTILWKSKMGKSQQPSLLLQRKVRTEAH